MWSKVWFRFTSAEDAAFGRSVPKKIEFIWKHKRKYLIGMRSSELVQNIEAHFNRFQEEHAWTTNCNRVSPEDSERYEKTSR